MRDLGPTLIFFGHRRRGRRRAVQFHLGAVPTACNKSNLVTCNQLPVISESLCPNFAALGLLAFFPFKEPAYEVPGKRSSPPKEFTARVRGSRASPPPLGPPVQVLLGKRRGAYSPRLAGLGIIPCADFVRWDCQVRGRRPTARRAAAGEGGGTFEEEGCGIPRFGSGLKAGP